MLNLVRSDGKILNGKSPIALIGGQYHLFSSTGLGDRVLVELVEGQ